ncbi:MAG TPA: RNA polymerase sigma factor SigJ [Caulobacteraceae bacterium]|nr:RNA polymerase sigma factor SigJ [Caulobacteraceae bacterium]
MTADVFEAERPRLKRLAYRMLASVSDAEEVARDAWLRWRAADQAAIEEPAAWLTRVTTRLCLDRLKSAARDRATYVGPWLPEPLVEDPADPVERAEEVSVAFLLALQRLTPLERAVFLLREVFEEDYAAIAEVLGREEGACRKLAERARSHVAAAKPRFIVPPGEARRLAQAFMDAARRGDVEGFGRLLADDCVLITDGGGKRSAALRPLVGREDILAFLRGIASRNPRSLAGVLRPARINVAPGAIIDSPDGVQTVALEPGDDGRLAAIYIVRNPEKQKTLSRET